MGALSFISSISILTCTAVLTNVPSDTVIRTNREIGSGSFSLLMNLSVLSMLVASDVVKLPDACNTFPSLEVINCTVGVVIIAKVSGKVIGLPLRSIRDTVINDNGKSSTSITTTSGEIKTPLTVPSTNTTAIGAL